jgi:hypothetical protein
MSRYIGCNDNEIWVGNIETQRNLSYLQNVKYRIGDQSLDIYGNKIDPALMRPLFVNNEDFQKYDKIMMDQLKEIRNFSKPVLRN